MTQVLNLARALDWKDVLQILLVAGGIYYLLYLRLMCESCAASAS